jgi:hypothetical protein
MFRFVQVQAVETRNPCYDVVVSVPLCSMEAMCAELDVLLVSLVVLAKVMIN